MIRIKTAIRGVGLATFLLFVLFASPVTTGFMVLLSAFSAGTDVATIALPALLSEHWWRIVGDVIAVLILLKYSAPELDLRKRKEE